MGAALIWPLAGKLFHPMFNRQRPRSSSGRPIPTVAVSKPWDAAGLPLVQDVLSLTQPSIIHQILPPPAYKFQISGVTKDSTGAILGSCTVKLFRTSDDGILQTTTSDATTGAYSFPDSISSVLPYYVTAYKAGSPDVAGLTVNTLVGT